MNKRYIILILILFSGSLNAQWEVKNVNESDYATINVIKFNDSGLGFAMGTNGLILRSEDVGDTWQNIESEIDGFISDFTFLSSDILFCTSYGFDGQTFTRKISKSDDSGITWTTQLEDEGDFNCIQSISSSSLIVSGSNRIYKSDDGGDSWAVVYDLLQEGYQFGDVRRFDMVNDSVGYAIGGGVEVVSDDFPGFVLKTVNGGSDWIVVSDQERWWQEVDFYNEVIGYASDGQDTYKTVDSGLTWDRVSNVYGVVDFSILSSSIIKTVNRPAAYIPGAGSTIFAISESTDVGETWSGEYMDGAHLESIFFVNDSLGFVAGDYSIIMKTENCGGEIIGDYPWHLFVNSTEDTGFSRINIYPNPATDFITIDDIDLRGSDYEIYSIGLGLFDFGTLLSNRVEVNHLPPGMYVLVVKKGNQRKISKFAVK